MGGEGQMYVINGSPLCPTGHRPFGAAAQKEGEDDKEVFKIDTPDEDLIESRLRLCA